MRFVREEYCKFQHYRCSSDDSLYSTYIFLTQWEDFYRKERLRVELFSHIGVLKIARKPIGL